MPNQHPRTAAVHTAVAAANKAAVRAAAEEIYAETGQAPTIAEIAACTGFADATVVKWRRALIAEDNYPFGVLHSGKHSGRKPQPRISNRPSFRQFDPKSPDDVLDAIPVEDVRERAKRIRELNGHMPDPRGVMV
jgi:hypothetical protein